jgi:hypothetical protein
MKNEKHFGIIRADLSCQTIWWVTGGLGGWVEVKVVLWTAYSIIKLAH